MASFSFGRIEVPGMEAPVYVDAFSAMYENAKRSGNAKLVEILEHRSEVHDGGPCRCKTKRDDQGNQVS